MTARYAVVRCSRCGGAWAVELRHGGAACPSCRTRADLRTAALPWTGDDRRAAQAAAAASRAQAAGADAGRLAALEARHGPARHDSPLDAAAAQARGIANASERAEAVALWLTRLCGGASHEDLLDAMDRAGIPPARAEAEVVRMLAMDIVLEPRPGRYRSLQA